MSIWFIIIGLIMDVSSIVAFIFGAIELMKILTTIGAVLIISGILLVIVEGMNV